MCSEHVAEVDGHLYIVRYTVQVMITFANNVMGSLSLGNIEWKLIFPAENGDTSICTISSDASVQYNSYEIPILAIGIIAHRQTSA